MKCSSLLAILFNVLILVIIAPTKAVAKEEFDAVPAPTKYRNCKVVGKTFPLRNRTDLSSNRFNAIRPGTLQITALYDGNMEANLRVQLMDPSTGTIYWATLNKIPSFDIRIETTEHNIKNLVLTGIFEVSGVRGNGVVDGLAFGIFWKDMKGQYHHMQSSDSNLLTRNTFVAAWPIGHSDHVFAQRTPQLTNGYGRELGRMMVYGAKLLSNGCYYIPIESGRKLY